MKPARVYPVLILAATLLTYGNSFSGPFIFDDLPWISANPQIRHLWPLWNTLQPPHGAAGTGRPLVCLTLALNYAVSGLNPSSYHALNLAIHAFAALDGERVNLSALMQSLKNVLSKKMRERCVALPHWQRGFFDHVLRSQESAAEKWKYVRENPVRVGLVNDSSEWRYPAKFLRWAIAWNVCDVRASVLWRRSMSFDGFRGLR
jgi:hypothetical protein